LIQRGQDRCQGHGRERGDELRPALHAHAYQGTPSDIADTVRSS